MAKPKGPTNSKTGNKFPAESSLEITEKQVPASLDLQLQQLKLDKASKTETKQLFNSPKQENQIQDRIAYMAKRLADERAVKDKKREEEKEKKPKTITLGPKVGIKRYISELKKGVCTVDFYKRTSQPRGEFRRIECTLQGKKVIPQNPINPGIITVWDLNKSEWRSFYHTSIIKLVRNEQTDAE